MWYASDCVLCFDNGKHVFVIPTFMVNGQMSSSRCDAMCKECHCLKQKFEMKINFLKLYLEFRNENQYDSEHMETFY